MKKIKASDVAKKEALTAKLRAAEEKLNEAIQEHNATIKKIEDASTEYDAIVEEVETLVNEVVSSMETYAEARTEKWTESENGEAFLAWKTDWEDFSSETVARCEVDVPEEMEEFELDLKDELDHLANEIE